jgi:hypothetical protein
VKTVSGRKTFRCFQLGHRATFARTLGREIGLNRQRRLVTGPPFPFSGGRTLLIRLILVGLGMTGIVSGADVSRSPVTFNRDVLPILVKSCQGCHSPGRIAPMPFTTYEETRPWAAAIRAVVVNKKMPPWINASHPGLFGDDGRLSQVEVDTIVAWVEDGAPEGNARDAKNSRREK